MATRPAHVALALLLAPMAAASGILFARLHDRPFDFSTASRRHGIELPGWLTDLKRNERVPYWAHASLGTVLLLTDADPNAAALQWAKASAHASGPFEVQLAARGVRDAAARFESGHDAVRFFCQFSRNDPTRRVHQVITEATIDCSAGTGS